jgi:hypothetical protein
MVKFSEGARVFLVPNMTQLGPIQPNFQWALCAPYPGLKCQGHETDHQPPSYAKLKNSWSYISAPHYNVCRDNFTFTVFCLCSCDRDKQMVASIAYIVP